MKWRRLGDTALWTSALQALVRHFPDAEIDLALPAEYDALFRAHPSFKTVFLLQSDASRLREHARQWRLRRYDWFLGFHANPTVRRLARASGATRQLLHHHDRRGLRFGSHLPIVDAGKPMSATERDTNVVRTLGYQGTTLPPQLTVASPDRTRMQAQWKARGGAPRYLVLSPGASRPSKRWPIDRWAALVDRLPSDIGIAVVSPSPAEWKGLEYFVQRMQKRAQFVFTPRLEDALGLLADAVVYVGADSGLKHCAAALGVPTVTLFGPESVGEWHPYPLDRHTVLRKAVTCRDRDPQDPAFAWCGREVCPLASHACLSQTPVEEVATAIGRYL